MANEVYQRVGTNLIEVPMSGGVAASEFNKLLQKVNDLEEAPHVFEGDTDLYIGGVNASDTLDEGRGLTEAKPFATLRAAANWAGTHLKGQGLAALQFVLLDNLTEDATGGYTMPQQNCATVRLRSKSSASIRRLTLTGSGSMNLQANCWEFQDIEIELNGQVMVNPVISYTYLIVRANVKIISHIASTSSVLRVSLAGITIAGTNIEFVSDGATYLEAMNNGTLNIASNITLTGQLANTTPVMRAQLCGAIIFSPITITCPTPSGMRYRAAYCGKILTGLKGPNFIPGAVAGEADETSIYY